MSNLIDHARRELALVEQGPDGDREFAASLQAAVNGFATYAGHSGGSHAVAVDWLTRLLRFENIAPLTDDPAEWADVEGEGGVTLIWQNRRCSEAFSDDGGRTYWLLSEGAHSAHREPRHLSQHYPTTPTQGVAPDPAPGQGEAACRPAGDECSDGADDHSVGPDAGEATPDSEEGGGVEPDGASPLLESLRRLLEYSVHTDRLAGKVLQVVEAYLSAAADDVARLTPMLDAVDPDRDAPDVTLSAGLYAAASLLRSWSS